MEKENPYSINDGETETVSSTPPDQEQKKSSREDDFFVLTPRNLASGLIYSEILGQPKCRRKGR